MLISIVLSARTEVKISMGEEVKTSQTARVLPFSVSEGRIPDWFLWKHKKHDFPQKPNNCEWTPTKKSPPRGYNFGVGAF